MGLMKNVHLQVIFYTDKLEFITERGKGMLNYMKPKNLSSIEPY